MKFFSLNKFQNVGHDEFIVINCLSKRYILKEQDIFLVIIYGVVTRGPLRLLFESIYFHDLLRVLPVSNFTPELDHTLTHTPLSHSYLAEKRLKFNGIFLIVKYKPVFVCNTRVSWTLQTISLLKILFSTLL